MVPLMSKSHATCVCLPLMWPLWTCPEYQSYSFEDNLSWSIPTVSSRHQPLTSRASVVIRLLWLEGTARYAGLPLAPAEGSGLRSRLLFPSGKKRAFHAICAYFRPFLCLIATSVTSSISLSNFENNPNNKKKIQKFNRSKNTPKNKTKI